MNDGLADQHFLLIALLAFFFGPMPFILLALALGVSVSILGDESLRWNRSPETQ